MVHGVHARLMITRGLKHTPYQSPKVNVGPPTICCIAEFKEAAVSGQHVEEPKGISLSTVWTRRGNADSQDQKLNSHSKINCISACIAAIKAGADHPNPTAL
jgi:branched-chain amino acid aminotransferase